MEKLLEKARKSKEKIEIIYFSSDEMISQRVIRVLECHELRILAFCYSKQQVRTFHKENILSAYPLTSKKKRGAS
ncbi:hypothetical protein [Halobacillus sp. A5]|uniref:hypothetical protein n=1 Tax=Halobacillus sp. A5 TaxID=2880263 RepID=UPI0020A66458|nr:hypothetical protein [Halobacillus sp. A5]MCP3028393.1 hypothetical protein [Halobacillus sp. A5]